MLELRLFLALEILNVPVNSCSLKRIEHTTRALYIEESGNEKKMYKVI